MKRTFYVKSLWDAEVNRWYSESDIIGLHIETKTIDEFEEVMNDVVLELILSNHMKITDMTNRPFKDWLPTIIWQKPFESVAA